GDVAACESECRAVVGRLQRFCVLEVDFVLRRRDLVMARLDLQPDRGEILDDQPPDLFRPVHWRQIEVASPIVRLSGRISPGIQLEDEKLDRKSTRLNSSHVWISYAVFC